MTRLRLFFWCEEFFSIGGCQVALQRQIGELLRLGHRVTVGSTDSDGPLAMEPTEGFEHLKLARVADIYQVMGAPYDALYVQRIFKGDPEGHLQALARLAPAIPTLLRVTTLGDLELLAPLDPAGSLTSLAGVVALGPELEREIQAVLPGAPIFAQRNGIAAGELSPGRFAADGPFLFIGRLSLSKGIDLLLHGWRRYRDEGGKRGLLIIGAPRRGYRQPELERPELLQRLGVTFIPGEARPWQRVERACALVKPSRAEGHSNTMLEAMAAGVPLLAADIPGLGGDITASGAGRLFAPGDAAALAGALAKVEGAPGELAPMAAAGPAFVAGERDLGATVADLLRAVEQVTGLVECGP